MEKIKSMKKMDWRQKVLLSICGSFIVIMSIVFSITYNYVSVKVEKSAERMTQLTFEQSEKNLKKILTNSERCLNKYMTQGSVWEFWEKKPEDAIESNKMKMRITKNFFSELALNDEIAALGVLAGDGYGVSTTSGKNRSGYTQITKEMKNILKNCQENYPYVVWISSWELQLKEAGALEIMIKKPALIGIRAVDGDKEVEDNSYLLIAIDEETLQSTYDTVVFNNSRAVLVDVEERVISGEEKETIGEVYQTEKSMHNIEYPLSFCGWKLCNMIPKQEYMKEANDIRDFGILTIGIAIVATVVVSIIWGRMYTRPIELLMSNMHHIKKQEFDIEKPKKLGWEELDQLNDELYATAQSIQAYIKRLKKAEKEKRKEELLALQYQMNPHFLLNSLNSIRWMAVMTNNTPIANTLVKLSKIINPMLRNPSFVWKIEDEIEFLENYVAMMQLRYGHNMEYLMDCPKEIYDKECPRFILQPLIENCFVHGSSSEEMRTIHVQISYQKEIDITVVNSGVFYNEEELEKIRRKMKTSEKTSEHIGLANVYKRLNLLYENQVNIDVQTDLEKGFVLHIHFPEYVETMDK